MLNRSIYMGRLVSDPELKVKQSGGKETAWCSFRIAVQRDYKKEGGTQADYIPCIAYGGQAKYLAEYGKKGYKVLAEGRTETGSYEKKDGQKVYTSQLAVTSLWILEYRPQSEQQHPERMHSARQEPSGRYGGTYSEKGNPEHPDAGKLSEGEMAVDEDCGYLDEGCYEYDYGIGI
jgi:single-strand DNA-binding protein